MHESDIYAGLTEIFQDVFLGFDRPVTAELSAKDVPGWDSFRQIEIVVATEERFGIRLDTRAVDRLTCVGDLVALIAAGRPG